MREQVERRSGRKVQQQLLEGGYLRNRDIERAHQQKVEVFVPPKGARTAKNRGRELELHRGDSVALQAWNSVWPARKGRKFTGSERRPAKQSTRTCAVIGA
jgi:D-lyxose ketol-isomerase